MSIKVMTYIWDNSEQSGTKLLCLLALADYANDEGEAFPGMAKLSQKCRFKDKDMRCIRRLLDDLEEAGEIAREQGTGIHTKNGVTNRYYLLKYRESMGIKGGLRNPRSNKEGVVQPPVGGAKKPPVEGVVQPTDPSVDPSVDPSYGEGKLSLSEPKHRNIRQSSAVEFMKEMQEIGLSKQETNDLVYHLSDILRKRLQCEEDDKVLNEMRGHILFLAKLGYKSTDSLDCLSATVRSNPQFMWRFKNTGRFPTISEIYNTAELIHRGELILLTAGTTTTPAVAKEVKMKTIILNGKEVTLEVVDEARQLYYDIEDPCRIIDETGKQRGYDDKKFEEMYVTKSSIR